MVGRHGSVLTDRCRRVSLATCRLPTRAVLHESGGYNLQEERRGEGGRGIKSRTVEIVVRELKFMFIN